MEIQIDDRESAIIPLIKDVNYVDYSVKRLQVGNYAIVYFGYILLIIERKTWEDLASSMRDGRKKNVKKLINVRADTDCKIAYLIEGTPCPLPNKKYGRMSSKYLQAHLDHLAFGDNIHIIHTTDKQHTADRLLELAKNLFSIKDIIKDIDNKIENAIKNKSVDEFSILKGNIHKIEEVEETKVEKTKASGGWNIATND
jgi:ERCC4-type nuclease